jgi:ferrochelatase
VCPGFAADCLETVEEVAEADRELFLRSGGERYHYIPALNENPEHIRMLAGLVENESRQWMADIEMYNEPEQTADRQQHAIKYGAEI